MLSTDGATALTRMGRVLSKQEVLQSDVILVATSDILFWETQDKLLHL